MLNIKWSDKTPVVETIVNGKTYSRPIPSKDLAKLMAKMNVFDSELMPVNTRYFSRSGQRTLIAVELPEGKRSLWPYDRKEPIKDVPMPPGVFIFNTFQDSYGKYIITGCGIWATKPPGIVNMKTRLYEYPLPNLYGSGEICWGSVENSTVSVKKLVGLEGVIQSFFGSKFNNDLEIMADIQGENFHIDDGNVQEYFEFLVNKKKFDPKWLQPDGRKTLESALKNIGKMTDRDVEDDDN